MGTVLGEVLTPALAWVSHKLLSHWNSPFFRGCHGKCLLTEQMIVPSCRPNCNSCCSTSCHCGEEWRAGSFGRGRRRCSTLYTKWLSALEGVLVVVSQNVTEGCGRRRGATVVVCLTFCRATTRAGTLRRADLANILSLTTATLVLKAGAVRTSGGFQSWSLKWWCQWGESSKIEDWTIHPLFPSHLIG